MKCSKPYTKRKRKIKKKTKKENIKGKGKSTAKEILEETKTSSSLLTIKIMKAFAKLRQKSDTPEIQFKKKKREKYAINKRCPLNLDQIKYRRGIENRKQEKYKFSTKHDSFYELFMRNNQGKEVSGREEEKNNLEKTFS